MLALFIHMNHHCKILSPLYCLVSSLTWLRENLCACRTLGSTRRATTRCRPLKGSRFLSLLLVTSTSFWKRWELGLKGFDALVFAQVDISQLQVVVYFFVVVQFGQAKILVDWNWTFKRRNTSRHTSAFFLLFAFYEQFAKHSKKSWKILATKQTKCLSFVPGWFHSSSCCGGESSAPMTQC